MSTYVFDTETLPNRTLYRAKNVETGDRWGVWLHEPDAPKRLRAFVEQPDAVFFGFNSAWFDDAIVAAMCAGRSSLEIKNIANDMIENSVPAWKARTKYSLPSLRMDAVDLIEVCPSFVGLKAYGARMHMPLLQDMPIAHDEVISDEQIPVVETYCDNDVDTTEALLNTLEKEILLRVKMSKIYGVDMRSKSDSQMAEHAYIKNLNLKRVDNVIPRTISYTPPTFLKFRDPELQALLERVSSTVFQMNQVTGHVILPEFLSKSTVKFGKGEYQLGVGGIHSTHDRQVCHVAGDDVICEIDGISFYPSIILMCGFGPASMGDAFVTEYRRIYNQRLEAKKAGDKATDATLKISLNGTFGKLASRWSVLYAPDLMLAVTLTGQFTLLMLMEWLEHAGVETLSANTDGVAVRYPKSLSTLVGSIVSKFSDVSRFGFEFTDYRTLAFKDVNSYFAVKTDKSVKRKGLYAPLDLRKNPTAGVCATAVAKWLSHGTPFIETIRSSRFVDFISARNVTGGGQQNNVYLGKVVRWYQSNAPGLEPLRYVKNGNKVPKTDGARACMKIEDPEKHPADLDYSWYYNECVIIANNVGCGAWLNAEEVKSAFLSRGVKREPKRLRVPDNEL